MATNAEVLVSNRLEELRERIRDCEKEIENEKDVIYTIEERREQYEEEIRRLNSLIQMGEDDILMGHRTISELESDLRDLDSEQEFFLNLQYEIARLIY